MIKTKRWFHVLNQLPMLGQKVEIRLSEHVTSEAHFTGVSFNPGKWCYGIFKEDMSSSGNEDFNTAVEWRPLSNISEPVGREVA